jgi:hypothetical protein
MSFARNRTRAPAVAPFDLPRNEMAFRKRYQRLLLTQKITTVFRPGDRLFPSWRGYAPGETIMARVIARVGSDARGVPPLFNKVCLPVRIEDVTVLPAIALGPEDFTGSSPDIFDVGSLLRHLAAIYGQPIEAYGGLVTRIRFAYLESCDERGVS